jgi:aquaporin Z
MRKLAAEFVGTFVLVFAGTGAITVNDVSDGTVSHVGVALTFGLAVSACRCVQGRRCCCAALQGLQP